MTEAVKRNIKPVLFAVAAIVGAIMIFASGGNGNNAESDNTTESIGLEEYATELEEKLMYIIESIEGAGEARVMISFESSFERVYAGNVRSEESGIQPSGTNTAKTTEKQIVLAGHGTSGEAPILLKEICPKVKGVAVVCAGADNENVVARIKETVAVLFGISDYKVFVTKGTE